MKSFSYQMLSLSIVSHHHGSLLPALLNQLQKYPEVTQIILTINTPEKIKFPAFQKILPIYNKKSQGFGSNHNSAFQHCTQPYFCVLNPDIEFQDNPFPQLINTLESQQAALVAPQILSSDGIPEDSIRIFPTLNSLTSKLLHGAEGRHATPENQSIHYPDWVAGMFMLFRSSDFAEIGGFDERYFLYYEDVDICARLHKANKTIVADLNATAIHHAQRASRKNLRHMRWHLASMMRYLWTHRDL